MAQEYYNLDKTAEVLGVNPADVHNLREQNELRGYRDGADWKFKVEDVQQKLAELIRARKTDHEEPDDAEDVLLSEVELGESGTGTGSVIGSPERGEPTASESDLRLVQSDVNIADGDEAPPDMDATVAAEDFQLQDSDATVTDDEEPAAEEGSVMDEIDLTLDEDATLQDSQVAVDKPKKSGSGSAVDLSEALEDDDLVLGGSSGSGSDITIGGDSGISLVDPADSGLSLEDPVDLVDVGDESLELGEDDMLVFNEEADSESPTELKTDDDFLLTPMGDGDEDDDSESGSQVIALDTEDEGDEAATMVAGAGGPEMAAMLDEDFSPDETPQVGVAAMGAAAPAAAAAVPQAGVDAGMVAALPEAPYSVWNVLSLTGCVIFLSLTGMMLFDLLRNMWSWGGAYSVNSSLMDMILNFM